MNILDALREGLAQLRPRTVSLRAGTRQASRRDPATRATSSDRRVHFGADAERLELRPTWLAGLYRRRHVKQRRGARLVKVPVPARKTVPAGSIVGLAYRPARRWWPGLVAVEVAAGHGDPWRWTSTDGTWRLRWWWSGRHGDQLRMLHRRLAWVLRANQATAARKL